MEMGRQSKHEHYNRLLLISFTGEITKRPLLHSLLCNSPLSQVSIIEHCFWTAASIFLRCLTVILLKQLYPLMQRCQSLFQAKWKFDLQGPHRSPVNTLQLLINNSGLGRPYS